MLWIKNILYTLLVPCTVAIYLPWLFLPDQPASSGIWLILAIGLFFLGTTVYAWCLWDFATVGEGTPSPFDAPTHLVVRGLYHYTRNPMYGSVLLLILGWIILFPSIPLLLYGLSVGFSCHLLVTLYEEPDLQKVFPSYGDYCKKVGRWIPRIRMRKTPKS
ncbi:MAG: isoprenylcysteine carboxylmethyltransferase family protein [Nitrospirota bacterium]|nr:isoprenylcysteine carboxylmethyltransferase family protein [Nitrospirota bacterium]MDH5775864.1 isoprenylcysteine carboxylmethyltransferase family protein [Nitrospirota bacterium]